MGMRFFTVVLRVLCNSYLKCFEIFEIVAQSVLSEVMSRSTRSAFKGILRHFLSFAKVRVAVREHGEEHQTIISQLISAFFQE